MAVKNENIDDLDILIGKRIRLRRNLMGMTQGALGQKIGISLQQIQKYETGQNKIYATRLYHIAVALNTPISYFVEDEQAVGTGLSDQAQGVFMQDDPLQKTETTTLIRTYYNIEDKKKRKTVIEMIKNMSS